jgi:hypothetical protein
MERRDVKDDRERKTRKCCISYTQKKTIFGVSRETETREYMKECDKGKIEQSKI